VTIGCHFKKGVIKILWKSNGNRDDSLLFDYDNKLLFEFRNEWMSYFYKVINDSLRPYNVNT